MATVEGNTDLYNSQVTACQKFFGEKLSNVPERKLLTGKKRPENMRSLEDGPIYLNDITGCDARKVIAVLVDIVNDREKFKAGQNFYLVLRNTVQPKDNQIEELFRLRANPRNDQPGNGRVFKLPRGKTEFEENAKSYQAIKEALQAHYKKDTTSFAKRIKKLFQNNAEFNSDFPEVTMEAYMLLLFEVARRLVELENPSELKKKYDKLPIGSAIARIVKLLEYGEEKSTFEHVFSNDGKFHCFTKLPPDRKKAIDEINKAASVNAKGKKEQLIKVATEELRETFSFNRSGSPVDPSFTNQFQKLDISKEKKTS